MEMYDGGWDGDDHRSHSADHSESPDERPAMTSFDDVKIAEAEVTALESALKKRLTAMLKGHQNLKALRSTMYTARGVATGLLESYNGAKALPATGNKDVLIKFFEQSQDRYAQAMVAEEAQQQAEFDEYNARTNLQELATQMTAILEALKAARPELTDNSTVQAADNLLARINQSIKPRSSDSTTASEFHPHDGVDETIAAELAEANLAQALLVDEARKLIAPVAAAKAEIELCRDCKDIPEPTRPTEEEVQRYLSQVETRTKLRQKAHRQGKVLFQQQQNFLTQLLKGSEGLQEILKRMEAVEHPAPQLEGLAAISDVVLELSKLVHNQLANACDYQDNFKSKLDVTEMPSPSASETKQIATMRLGLREVGYSLGRLNEALAAEKATLKSTVAKVERRGVGAATSYEETQTWLAEIKAQTARAEKNEISRATKIELLAESVKAYKEETQNNKVALHRLVITTTPRRGGKPCDELRALLNAAAWMYNSLGESEGAFPLY